MHVKYIPQIRHSAFAHVGIKLNLNSPQYDSYLVKVVVASAKPVGCVELHSVKDGSVCCKIA